MGIAPFNEVQLPGTHPLLDGFLATYGRLHGFVQFVPDQPMDVIAMGETLHNTIAVLPDTSWKIGGDTRVQGAISSTGKKIDARLAVTHGNGSDLAPPELAAVNNLIRPSSPRRRGSSAFLRRDAAV